MSTTLLDLPSTNELREDDVIHIVRNLSAGEAPGGIAGYYDMQYTSIPVTSGTYTPVISNKVNISGVVAPPEPWIWSRVGDLVSVSGAIDVSATTGFAPSFEATLPIPSNGGGADHEVGGWAASPLGDDNYGISAIGTGAKFFNPYANSARISHTLNFSYRIR